MKTGKILTLAAIFFLFSCSSRQTGAPLISDLSYDPIDNIVRNISSNRKNLKTGKIAVYEFTDISGKTNLEGKLLAERLTTKLAQTGEFTVIERTRLEAALRELNLSSSGAIDEKNAVKAGKTLGAEVVLTGTLAPMGNKFEINARLMETETGMILTGVIAQVRREDLEVREETEYEHKKTAVMPVIRETVQNPTEPLKSKILKGWEEWPGWENRHGKYKYQGGKIYYYLESSQHDHMDFPKNGYYPSLLLTREIEGNEWIIETKVTNNISKGGGKWLSFYVWIGKKDARPIILSPKSSCIVYAQRVMGNSEQDEIYRLRPIHDGIDKWLQIPKNASYLRFRRGKNLFSAFYSEDGTNYVKVFTEEVSADLRGLSQKIVLGGQAFSSSGDFAEYEYIKLNGKPLF